mgnify:CR=1 FL=1
MPGAAPPPKPPPPGYLHILATEEGAARPMLRTARKFGDAEDAPGLVRQVLGKARLVVCGITPCPLVDKAVLVRFWRAASAETPPPADADQLFARRSDLDELIIRFTANEPAAPGATGFRKRRQKKGKKTRRGAWYDRRPGERERGEKK